ncbi:DUF4065 domain-containing protein [Klebsiella michiganensis]|uniref:Panacea domain-containing protein n=1 Tax=Klebsiella TaxID=570 RepID=UPI001CCB43E3|nr:MULTISPECIES: type II toxin-antitoxin system antitoxin SocA domain-containing protein [Klebsiella]MBZ7623492.1 DUF4065 domain-containing protein [Klebsiella michiganensis]WII80390.1 DUF4065 domain-containing protein [Klebsiella pasteurii]
MAYSAQAVANAFIDRAQKGFIPDLTPMKVQKLLFYTQSWYLRFNQGNPLFDDNFERWRFGPVIPSIYHELKPYGYHTVTRKISGVIQTPQGLRIVTPEINCADEAAIQLIDQIANAYGKYSGSELSAMTHAPGSAWTLGPDDGSIITLEQMKNNIHPQ